MAKAETYEHYAIACLDMAERVEDAAMKLKLMEMAQKCGAWRSAPRRWWPLAGRRSEVRFYGLEAPRSACVWSIFSNLQPPRHTSTSWRPSSVLASSLASASEAQFTSLLPMNVPHLFTV